MHQLANDPLVLKAPFAPCGDQPKAIEALTRGVREGKRFQTLLGVTGSGKTFSIAHVLQNEQRPALIIAPNKTLAAQLYSEFKEFFPENRVHYFVSYYDYYQPEAYVPSTDTYIEKDSAINEEIDKMRHAATKALLETRGAIIIASVSCIYGLGAPEEYLNNMLPLEVGQTIVRNDVMLRLASLQYRRSEIEFSRGNFRVRGEVLDVFPSDDDSQAIRNVFFGDIIEELRLIDPLSGATIKKIQRAHIYPVSHYVTGTEGVIKARKLIAAELEERLRFLREQGKISESERLERRTRYDLELLQEIGFCPGIENYSRHLAGRKEGEPSTTLLDYFPKDFILVIDESHVTVSQIGGMFRGDRSRKQTLVDYGFRLPSALDNRPLTFDEFWARVGQTIFVSATPADFELEKSGSAVIEQVNRPTGLIDPPIEIHPATNQVDDLLIEMKKTIGQGDRVLVTTLTKKMAEDLSAYLREIGVTSRYLHSDVTTIERVEILRALREGQFDVLIGINLLREGLDLVEVALVAILDADKEGFLRSTRSLIQTMGRAARNVRGRVILYADRTTDSMAAAIKECERRRAIQIAYNTAHGITPKSAKSSISQLLVSDQLLEQQEKLLGITVPKDVRGQKKLIEKLRKEMFDHAAKKEFEEAARLRDAIAQIQRALTELAGEESV